MNEPVINRERIAMLAEAAAEQMARTGIAANNPYPPQSQAAKIFEVDLQRQLQRHSAPEGSEGGA